MTEWTVYLSGEIHSDWRDRVVEAAATLDLPLRFTTPVTDHGASDECGVAIMGSETSAFWKDHKGAKLNGIRTRILIERSDVVVVRFGDRYKQWNAAFDAGYAAALGKPLIVNHEPGLTHPLKEVDAAAMAVCATPEQVVAALRYVTTGELLD